MERLVHADLVGPDGLNAFPQRLEARALGADTADKHGSQAGSGGSAGRVATKVTPVERTGFQLGHAVSALLNTELRLTSWVGAGEAHGRWYLGGPGIGNKYLRTGEGCVDVGVAERIDKREAQAVGAAERLAY